MRFSFTPAQEAFRAEVRNFLESEIEAGSFSTRCGDLVQPGSREFSRKLAQRGWIGMTWPRAYGGQGRPYVDKAILMEELFRVQAPLGYHFLADRQVGPALIHFGSEQQKAFFLPRIVRADEGVAFCLLVCLRKRLRDEFRRRPGGNPPAGSEHLRPARGRLGGTVP